MNSYDRHEFMRVFQGSVAKQTLEFPAVKQALTDIVEGGLPLIHTLAKMVDTLVHHIELIEAAAPLPPGVDNTIHIEKKMRDSR